MGDNRTLFSLYGKSPIYQLSFSLVVVLVAGSILFTGFLIAGKLIFTGDSGLFELASSGAGEESVSFLRYILLSQHISFFIVPAIVLLIMLNPPSQKGFEDIKTPILTDVALVIVLAFCIFPVTSFTGQLNSAMHLPYWLSGVERWMAEKEESVARIEKMFMKPGDFRAMLSNLLMIAVLPAIGEELIFRGVFQKIFYSLFKSGHLAIWFTAFIFSALHFQFFGFLPRFILGLIFGYLFFWSGTLWLPVISHFVNNAVSVLAVYFQDIEKVNALPDIPLWKQLAGLPLSIIIIVIILLYFSNKSVTGISKRTGESG
jgi:uncharacterized protein